MKDCFGRFDKSVLNDETGVMERQEEEERKSGLEVSYVLVRMKMMITD